MRWISGENCWSDHVFFFPQTCSTLSSFFPSSLPLFVPSAFWLCFYCRCPISHLSMSDVPPYLFTFSPAGHSPPLLSPPVLLLFSLPRCVFRSVRRSESLCVERRHSRRGGSARAKQSRSRSDVDLQSTATSHPLSPSPQNPPSTL